jgi:PEP-CTERM motif-containing protein
LLLAEFPDADYDEKRSHSLLFSEELGEMKTFTKFLMCLAIAAGMFLILLLDQAKAAPISVNELNPVVNLDFPPHPGILAICERVSGQPVIGRQQKVNNPLNGLCPGGNAQNIFTNVSDEVRFRVNPNQAIMISDRTEGLEEAFGADTGNFLGPANVPPATDFFQITEPEKPELATGEETFTYIPLAEPVLEPGNFVFPSRDLAQYQITSDIIPEPGTLSLFATGILLLGAGVRKRRS